MAKAKNQTTKTKNVSTSDLDAGFILHRHEQQQAMDEAEQRFYTKVVWMMGQDDEIPSEDDEKAAQLIAQKGGYDMDADVKAVKATVRHWVTLNGDDPEQWDETIRLASISSQDAADAHKETEQRCQDEIQRSRAEAFEAGYKVRSLASSKTEIQKYERNHPHLFTGENGGAK